MPVRYYINSQLDMVIYVCRGQLTTYDLFDAADRFYVDPHWLPNKITFYDLFRAAENIDLYQMHEAVRRLEKAANRRQGAGPRVVLTHSQGVHLFVEAMKLLSKDVPIEIDSYYTIEDAIAGLGLVESKQEIIQFWRECNSQFDNS